MQEGHARLTNWPRWASLLMQQMGAKVNDVFEFAEVGLPADAAVGAEVNNVIEVQQWNHPQCNTWNNLP